MENDHGTALLITCTGIASIKEQVSTLDIFSICQVNKGNFSILNIKC